MFIYNDNDNNNSKIGTPNKGRNGRLFTNKLVR